MYVAALYMFSCWQTLKERFKLTRSLSDWYTIKAVGQDEFEDVKVPDAPRQQQPAKSN